MIISRARHQADRLPGIASGPLPLSNRQPLSPEHDPSDIVFGCRPLDRFAPRALRLRSSRCHLRPLDRAACMRLLSSRRHLHPNVCASPSMLAWSHHHLQRPRASPSPATLCIATCIIIACIYHRPCVHPALLSFLHSVARSALAKLAKPWRRSAELSTAWCSRARRCGSRPSPAHLLDASSPAGPSFGPHSLPRWVYCLDAFTASMR